jgi:hypothetical protein
MRSWIFRNRARLAALMGRPAPAAGMGPSSEASPPRSPAPPRTPRVVVLVPVRHP